MCHICMYQKSHEDAELITLCFILQTDWQPTYTLEFLHNNVTRHCYTNTKCYHILQYEFHQDSHNTSKQEMEQFQI
jgi:hypothetical protein